MRKLAIVALSGVIAAGFLRAAAAADTAPQVGQPFPALKFTSLEGKEVDLKELKGKVVLIDFWATWCGPCMREMPHVLKTYQQYKEKGFEVVGISLDKDRERLLAVLKDKAMTWPQHFDGKGWNNEIASRFGIRSIPASYLLDRQGVLREVNLRGEKLQSAVGKLTQQGTANP